MTQPTVTLPVDLERVHRLDATEQSFLVPSLWPGRTTVYVVQPNEDSEGDEVAPVVTILVVERYANLELKAVENP